MAYTVDYLRQVAMDTWNTARSKDTREQAADVILQTLIVVIRGLSEPPKEETKKKK